MPKKMFLLSQGLKKKKKKAIVGTLLAHKPCTCSALRSKKEPRVSNRDISDLGMGELTCLRQDPGATMCSRQQAGEGGHPRWVGWGRGKTASYRGN